jgi:BirA family biotin operon repressor/biotin-[acetyl-CoA-carboxylase] ligase
LSIDRRLIGFLAPGRFVSGQQMAERLGISRAAVNQHVSRLREQGVDIHSVRGRGYRLVRPLEPLDAAAILKNLSPQAARRLPVIEVYDEVDSTNRQLRDTLVAGRDADACLAEYQSAGRGRLGRRWLAAPFGSILLSVAHVLPAGPAASAGLSLAVGVAVARGLERCGCPDVALKWPNDLLLGGAKCGGILVEIAGELTAGCLCIVGVGVNVVMTEKLAAQCDRPATCVADHVAESPSRNRLAAALFSSIVEVLDMFNHSGFAPFRREWGLRDAYRGHRVKVKLGDRVVEGIARGVGEDGALHLQDERGQINRITTGEVMA